MPDEKVWIFMGSESDRPVMAKAAERLKDLGIGSRLTVASAHRSPDYLERLIKDAGDRARVFIAGAGGAAHLAGVVASKTTKPVIGVPMSTKMGGIDSLLSTVQMPKGVPVATVAVDGAENAAILAAQMLALGDPELARRLKEHREKQAREIEAGAAPAAAAK